LGATLVQIFVSVGMKIIDAGRASCALVSARQDQSNQLDSIVQLNQTLVDIVYSNEGSNFYFDSSGFVLVYQKACTNLELPSIKNHPQ
jgi:hypothetical protein